MHAVRDARRHAANEFLPVDREAGLEDRVHEQQHRIPRGHFAVPHHERDRELGEHEADEVRAAVAEEDEARREVPDEKAHDRAHHHDRAGHHDRVADLERDVRERREHHERDHRREAVEAVDDVDRVRERGDGEHRDRGRDRRIAEQEVEGRHADARDRDAHQRERERRGRHRADEPHRGRHLLRQVFDQPGGEGGQPARGEPEDAARDRRVSPRQQRRRDDEPDQDAGAAHARHRPRMEFLHAGKIVVDRESFVQVRIADDEQRDEKRDDEADGEAEHGRARKLDSGLYKTARVVLLPAPVVRAHPLEVALGLPSDRLGRRGGVRVALGDVARAARDEFVRHGAPRRLLERAHDFEHAVAAARAEVDGEARVAALERVERRDVAAREIDDVDVIAHAGAVGRRVVAAEHAQLLELAHRDLRDVRHQVVRNAGRVLADEAAFVRADRIEVAQRRDAPGRIGGFDIAQDLLGHQLRLAVRVGRRKRERLVDRRALGYAVYGRRRAEHDPLHGALAHHAQQRQQAVEVVAVVLDGLRDRFADRLQRREMDRGRDRMRVEDPRERALVAHVGFVKRRRLAGDLLDPRDRLALAVDEVVGDHDVVAVREQLDGGVRTDIARAAGDEDRALRAHC
ncbi:hypothetical protein BURPS1710b_3148 [Burkholderia pseudomallei 1710b]|uniref:Uncharacterized protein n=1 Tax=Burkholderia pseudomallei (strain 1710b) TaxID=320372 RepID=Q3JPI4_BURP1|nr:hypothetical protein BURPS1710b_3148 [Burkholderia pseudomallei 1710b]